jgi:flagellar biosynthesis GTPase FlhF
MNKLKAIDLFTEQANVLFFGYPGSGITVSMAKIAARVFTVGKRKGTFISSDEFQAGIGHKIEMLAATLDMEYQANTIAELGKLTDTNNFIRLRCPSIATIAEYQPIFRNQTFKKALVLDCTRKDDVNTELIRLIGKEAIDGIILTKIDLVHDKMAVYEYLNSLELPIAYLSYGERILYDGSFPTEKMLRDILCENSAKSSRTLTPEVRGGVIY